MPMYTVKCQNTECGVIAEKLCSYSAVLTIKCEICGFETKLVPAKSLFKVHGYNFQNGYNRETINYDGSPG